MTVEIKILITHPEPSRILLHVVEIRGMPDKQASQWSVPSGQLFAQDWTVIFGAENSGTF